MVQNEVKKSSPDELKVQVDSMVCVENITRFANTKKYDVEVEKQDGEFTLTLKKRK
jgi:TusA-related sulfurtransferase